MAVVCWVGADGSLGRMEMDPWPPGTENPAPEGATVIAEIQWNQMWADLNADAGQPTINVDNANPFG